MYLLACCVVKNIMLSLLPWKPVSGFIHKNCFVYLFENTMRHNLHANATNHM